MPARKIIRIDEDLCDGCGLCIPACAEGALEVVNGKVRVVADLLCDGLGACLGECPRGALSIEEREAPEFDEDAVADRLQALGRLGEHAEHSRPLAAPAVCPASVSLDLTRDRGSACPRPGPSEAAASGGSFLGNWPVQLALVNPRAPLFRGADLLIAADCVPAAYRLFQEDLLQGRTLVIFCPKLDDIGPYLTKLAELFAAAHPRSVTVVHMEVPCCFGLINLVKRAAEMSGLEVTIDEVVVGVIGERVEAAPVSCPAPNPAGRR